MKLGNNSGLVSIPNPYPDGLIIKDAKVFFAWIAGGIHLNKK